MIFTVSEEDVANLNDGDLRTLTAFLAQQELLKQGFSTSHVTHGGDQRAADGGIDVRVALDSSATTSGYVPRAQTGFQVKAEDMPASNIAGEMTTKAGQLKPVISELAAQSGSYVIVSSKGTVSDIYLTKRKKAMRDAVASDPNAGQLHVDFYDRRRLADWINNYPGLVTWVKSRSTRPLKGWKPFEDWSSSPSDLSESYVVDTEVRVYSGASRLGEGANSEDAINDMREVIAAPGGVARLVGLSGVGKTRFAQALFDPTIGVNALSPQRAVYTDFSDEPDPSPQVVLAELLDAGKRAVLIVDNCGPVLHNKLTAQIAKQSNPTVSLVTIEYDISDDEPENTNVFRIEPASSAVLAQILKRKFADLTAPEIDKICDFSEGNFRIAIALARTSRTGQSLSDLKDRDLFTRLLEQNKGENSSLLTTAMVCALVHSFDIEMDLGENSELSALARLAQQTPTDFHRNVAELKRRDLVQARGKWRALLPHAMAHKLARQALEDYPFALLRQWLDTAPFRLRKSFYHRIGYLHDSPAAQALAQACLAPTGPLDDITEVEGEWLTILEYVAPADPQAVLVSIERAVIKDPSLLKSESRRTTAIIELLRLIAYDPALFDRCAALLADPALSQTSSSNSTDPLNVFTSLFTVYLSGSLATPEQRLNVIRRLAAGSAEQQALAMNALDSYLETQFSSVYNFTFGARKRHYGYHPTTDVEFAAWYEKGLDLLNELAAVPAIRPRIVAYLARNIRHLATFAPGALTGAIRAAAFLRDNGGWPEGWAPVRFAARDIRALDREEDARQLDELAATLAPASFHERFVAYVEPDQLGPLDSIDTDGEVDALETAMAQADSAARAVGAEMANDLDLIAQYLPGIVGLTNNRGSVLVEEIARTTTDPEAVWQIIEAEIVKAKHQGIVYALPGAFVRGLRSKDPVAVEAILDRLATTTLLKPYLWRIQGEAGLNPTGVERLLKSAADPEVSAFGIGLIFCSALQALTPEQFKSLVLAVAERQDGNYAARHLMYFRVFNVDPTAIDEVDKATGRLLLDQMTFATKHNNSEPHELGRIIRACLRAPVDETLARRLLERISLALKTYQMHSLDLGKVAGQILRLFPQAGLDVLLEQYGKENSDRQLFETSSIRRSPLDGIDVDTLITWAQARPDTRYAVLANAVRVFQKADVSADNPSANEDDGAPIVWTEIALKILDAAPSRADALSILIARLEPYSYSGRFSDILASRLPLLRAFQNDADAATAAVARAALMRWEGALSREQSSEKASNKNDHLTFE